MASYAVVDAQYLPELGFPEFTSKLISDVFNTLISSNMTQTEMYIELVKQVSKTLTEFINTTKDDIGGDMILQFLATVAPDTSSSSKTLIRDDNSSNLTTDQAAAINSAIAIDGYTPQTTVTTTDTVATQYDAILEAVAKRIAADKYTVLKEMVKLGILRVVVNQGEIETSLDFRTHASNFYNNTSTKYNRSQFDFNASASTGGFLSKWIKASASTNYTQLSVKTDTSTSGGNTSTDVKITGRVKIVFSTDYQALSSTS